MWHVAMQRGCRPASQWSYNVGPHRQKVAGLEGLSQAAVLVHVDGLQRLAKCKDVGVVLVLGLALANHDTAAAIVGVGRQAHTVHLLDAAATVARRADEHACGGDVQVGDAHGAVLAQQHLDAVRLPAVLEVRGSTLLTIRLHGTSRCRWKAWASMHTRLCTTVYPSFRLGQVRQVGCKLAQTSASLKECW